MKSPTLGDKWAMSSVAMSEDGGMKVTLSCGHRRTIRVPKLERFTISTVRQGRKMTHYVNGVEVKARCRRGCR